MCVETPTHARTRKGNNKVTVSVLNPFNLPVGTVGLSCQCIHTDAHTYENEPSSKKKHFQNDLKWEGSSLAIEDIFSLVKGLIFSNKQLIPIFPLQNSNRDSVQPAPTHVGEAYADIKSTSPTL